MKILIPGEDEEGMKCMKRTKIWVYNNSLGNTKNSPLILYRTGKQTFGHQSSGPTCKGPLSASTGPIERLFNAPRTILDLR